MRLPRDAPTAFRIRDLFRKNPIAREVIRIAVPGVAERIILNMGLLSPFMLGLAAAQPFLPMHFTLGGAHRGAGDTMTPLLAALVGDWAIRVPVAVLIDTVLELEVVWLWATLIFDRMARAAWLGVSFLRGHRSETRSGLDRSPTTQRL